MEQGVKICKICGKEYPYCKNWNNADIFRWQDVACCEEHGKEYFAQVLKARGEEPAEKEEATRKIERKHSKSEENSTEK